MPDHPPDGVDPIASADDRTPMSSRDLERWADNARASLWESRVTAAFGRAPGVGGKPADTWVSFNSKVGTARLVRSNDGTSRRTASRHRDGVDLISATADVTLARHLCELAAAIS